MNDDLIPVSFTPDELGVLCDIIKEKQRFYSFLDIKLHREYNNYNEKKYVPFTDKNS